jgi:hypothetical protein
VPFGLADQDGPVEDGVVDAHRHAFGPVGEVEDQLGDPGDRLVGGDAFGSGPVGGDAVDLGRGVGDVDAGVDDRRPLEVECTVGPDDCRGDLDDPVLERVHAGRLAVD